MMGSMVYLMSSLRGSGSVKLTFKNTVVSDEKIAFLPRNQNPTTPLYSFCTHLKMNQGLNALNM
eukprot:1145748-Pelagomonas_calceolata.AAC.1